MPNKYPEWVQTRRTRKSGGSKVFPPIAMRMEKLRNEAGFTLIELLVVVTLPFHKLPYSEPQPN